MNTRYCTRFYSAYDVKGITEFLDRMAMKGWILKSKSGIGYKFEKTDIPYFRYDITFFADASKDNDYLPYGSDRYFEMRQAAGWQFVTNDNKMMIFISENPDAPPLETEPMMKVDVIHNSYMRHYLFMDLLLVFNTWTAFARMMDDHKSSLAIELVDMMLCTAGVIGIINILSYFIWFLKAKKAAREGWFYRTKTPILEFYAMPVVFTVMAISLMFNLGWKASVFFIIVGIIAIKTAE